MRIALNAHLLSLAPSYRQAGISRLIYNLVRGLRDQPRKHQYTVFVGDRRAPAELAGAAMRVIVSRMPTVRPPIRILWEQWVLPIVLWRMGMDLFHALAFVQPVVCPCPTVVTVYDLSFLLYPRAFNRLNRAYLSIATPWSVRHAARVIAISESTKRDLVRLTHIPAERVQVVYPGVEEVFQPIRDPAVVAALRRRHHLPEHIILFVGTLEPRKNVERLVRAYARLRGMGITEHRLVLAGGTGWRYQGVYRVIEELGLQGDVLLPGYIPSAELPLWYAAADLFVYPSLYEGFGLPVLEALACGVPTIASTTSSLPEVAGDAAVLVDPRDEEGLALAMARVLQDEAFRDQLRHRGLRQAARFPLQAMIRETVGIYEELEHLRTVV